LLSRTLAWSALVGACAVLFAYPLCRRGIVLSDEGYLLMQALEMTRGGVLYRDLDAFVAPGVWFLLAGLFQLVEPSVLASRLLALGCFIATLGVSARIAWRLGGPRHALAVTAALLVASVWAFPAWTWSFYSPYAVLFALAGLERLLAWREARRLRQLLAAGVLLGTAAVFKQNYGALALLGAALALGAIVVEAGGASRQRAGRLVRAGFVLMAGAAAAALPAVAYFAWHGALGDAFEALVLQPIGGFLGQHDIAYLSPAEIFVRDQMGGLGRLTYASFALSNTSMRFDWPGPLLRGVEVLHVLLYWAPPLIFAAGAVRLWRSWRRERRLDAGLASLLSVCGLLFLGVFPRADYNHLMNVYQPVVLAAVVVLGDLPGRLVRGGRRRRFGLACATALLVAYVGVAADWYVELLRSMDTELPERRGGVLLNREAQKMLSFEVRSIQQATRPGEAVLTLPGFAMLNFLAERPMPGRHHNFYAVHIARDQGAEVVRALEEQRVRLVVADYDDFFSERVGLREYAPKLTRHLRRHFVPAFSISVDEHLFLVRRPTRLPAWDSRSAVDDCDTSRFRWRQRGVVQHLLFETLYHAHQVGDRPPRAQVDTLCRVSVPPEAHLAFAVGYRQPTRVVPDTSVQMEIWLQPLGQEEAAPQAVYGEVLVPGAAIGWQSPPPVERRIDLSPWAGREVLLLFRSLYRGEARMQPLDFKGFAVYWQDPQIEHPGETGADAPARAYSR
jgi:hypothetical protein